VDFLINKKGLVEHLPCAPIAETLDTECALFWNKHADIAINYIPGRGKIVPRNVIM